MGSLSEINLSLWVGTTTSSSGGAPGFHELHGDMTADVVVVGAGIAGLTAAALLEADGRRVVVIEAGRRRGAWRPGASASRPARRGQDGASGPSCSSSRPAYVDRR